jgi:hypothetical protein
MKSKLLNSLLIFLVTFTSVFLFLTCNDKKKENTSSQDVVAPENEPISTLKPETPKPEVHEFNWYCTNILGKSLSEVRNQFGKQNDCIGCTEESGELIYREIMVDAMGTEQSLGISYYKGVITRCSVIGSYPAVECVKAYEGE